MLLLDHPSLAHMQYPEEYNPHVMAEFWSKHPEAVSMRLNQVMGVFSQVIGQFSFNVFTGTVRRHAVRRGPILTPRPYGAGFF